MGACSTNNQTAGPAADQHRSEQVVNGVVCTGQPAMRTVHPGVRSTRSHAARVWCLCVLPPRTKPRIAHCMHRDARLKTADAGSIRTSKRRRLHLAHCGAAPAAAGGVVGGADAPGAVLVETNRAGIARTTRSSRWSTRPGRISQDCSRQSLTRCTWVQGCRKTAGWGSRGCLCPGDHRLR